MHRKPIIVMMRQQDKSKDNRSIRTPRSMLTSVSVVFLLAGGLHLSNIRKTSIYTLQDFVPEEAETSASLSKSSTTNDDDGADKMLRHHHPYFSLTPSPHSFHPKWKLWTEMNKAQQTDAMKEAGSYLQKYGQLITNVPRRRNHKHGTCEFDPTIGSTGHKICLPRPNSTKPCTFISFGINDDPSWDREVADTWGCRGFAGDPTVPHPSKLHPKVTFHNLGASMLMDNEEREIDKGGSEEWWLTSMPKLRYFLGLERIELLKLDCEGCEITLARDMLREDPYYLTRVDQVSIEAHVTRTWINSTEHVYYFGMLFALLEEAGFVMEWSSVFGCSKRHEITGCVPELEKYSYPCGYDPWPGKTKVVLGRSCQEFTWKRYPEKQTIQVPEYAT